MDDADNFRGLILKSRYCLLEKIGGGGGGNVFLARDLELGVMWAVKQIPRENEKEIRFMLELDHPSFPRIIDYEKTEDSCFIVMEYIRGKNLREYVDEKGGLSRKELLKCGIAAARALHYMHEKTPPLLYGDMKPENLMLSDNGRICLVDAGGICAGYRPRQRICVGTKGFAAPEQYEGRICVESDVYGFGKTLLALCKKTFFRLLFTDPCLAFLIFRCCLKHEKLRWHSMEKLQKKLEKMQEFSAKTRAALLAVLAVCVGFFVLMSVMFLTSNKEMDFEEQLSGITAAYYCEEFLKGDENDRDKICRGVQKDLQALLRSCKTEQQKLCVLKLLAANSVCLGDSRQAGTYYEQLLLNREGQSEVGAEYGLYLWTHGQSGKSRSLWEEFGKAEDDSDRNQKLWKALIEGESG